MRRTLSFLYLVCVMLPILAQGCNAGMYHGAQLHTPTSRCDGLQGCASLLLRRLDIASPFKVVRELMAATS
jgi:hypothetical protein